METRKHIRVKSRVRFTAFVAVTIILAVVGFNTIFGLNAVSGESDHDYITVEVMPGETLWDIAAEHMSSDIDQRKAVYLIEKENDLNDASIKPGQLLKVPV